MNRGRKRLILLVFSAALALAPAASAAGSGSWSAGGFWGAERWVWLDRVLEVLGLEAGGSRDPDGDAPAVGVSGDPDGAAAAGWEFVSLPEGGSGDPDGREIVPPAPPLRASSASGPVSDGH